MKPAASIARHLKQAPDPLGFDALRLQAITAAQQASGELWTDYNLHDPGVTLLEALCFALTEDIFAARQTVPQLLGLDAQAGNAAWARFGLHTPQALLPCHPCTRDDWQSWLLLELPNARHLHMTPQQDADGRGTGLWRLTLQSHSPADDAQRELRTKALKTYWQLRNLGEDLDGPPRMLRPRWVYLQVSLQLKGHRDICDLLTELLQRCDDCISARLPAGLPPATGTDPDVEGPLGRPLTREEAQWLEQDPDLLFFSDLARHLQDIDGLASIDSLELTPMPMPGEPQEQRDDSQPPPRFMPRHGHDWALQLRWPKSENELRGWRLTRDGGPVQVPVQPLLQMLRDRRHLPLRLATASAPRTVAPLQPDDRLPDLPTLRRDHYAASAALPPLYRQALLDHARREPGLRDQWHGYLALLEQGLNQVQVQREQLPHLYALDEEDTRSCWASLPGDEQLAGVQALYLQPRERLELESWVDEDQLSRRHRALDYQLALHGESLDHTGLQTLPCYFTPQAWPVHLLRLKRQFASRLLRLGRQRGVGADISKATLDRPANPDKREQLDNTPPLQERLSLMLGLARTHSRLLSDSWQARGLPVPQEWPEPTTRDTGNGVFILEAPKDPHALIDPAAPRQGSHWPALRQAMPVLRDTVPAPLLRAAVRPDLFQWTASIGGQLWLGPDDRGRYWLLTERCDKARAQQHARALHDAACQVQACGEGLHLVEHLLLRHLPGDDAGKAMPNATGVQISLVFSGWTARGADPRFRQLAQQIVAREAPAHLRCRLLWLDAGQMQAFEAAWRAWLNARRAHCKALLSADSQPSKSASLKQLNDCSARLRALLP